MTNEYVQKWYKWEMMIHTKPNLKLSEWWKISKPNMPHGSVQIIKPTWQD